MAETAKSKARRALDPGDVFRATQGFGTRETRVIRGEFRGVRLAVLRWACILNKRYKPPMFKAVARSHCCKCCAIPASTTSKNGKIAVAKSPRQKRWF